MASYKVGSTVETSAQQQGIIRYKGPIHVAEGNWLGIELPTPDGKNDGSVRGERYFTCPLYHGLFVRETSIIRVIAPPPTPAARPESTSAASKSVKPAPKAPAAKPRPSSVVAPKPAPRTSIINKRQSFTPTTQASARTPVRKPSISGASALSSTTPSTSTASKSARDQDIATLQTKLRHLEKQHTDDQELIKELTQAKDERDRFQGLLQKVQSKYQTLHSNHTQLKDDLEKANSEAARLENKVQEFEFTAEGATLDMMMIEGRAEEAEEEVKNLKSLLEETTMELEILREEATLFTADMSEEERQQAGYYKLQHENNRLREALITLKDMTVEQEQDLKHRINELETDVSTLEKLKEDKATLEEQVTKSTDIISHLQGQLDANSEWEEINEELTSKNQALEDQLAERDAVIRDLEAIKELNDELEVQHLEQEEELRVELEAKDVELSQQAQQLHDQSATLADQEDLITKLRDLVFELQSKMADAESSRTMTEAHAKDTTTRFNEVMDLNRRLRASNVQAINKEIKSELRHLQANEATEKLEIMTQTQSADFNNSESLRAYFTAKGVASKSMLVSTLLSTTDRQLSYNGGLEEASSRLACIEAIYNLDVIKIGSDRLWSTMSASSLPDFSTFGPVYQELITVEKALDQGLEGLKADEVQFSELAESFGRSIKIQDAVLSSRQTALSAHPEDETLARMKKIASSLRYLDSNFAVVTTMIRFLATDGGDLQERAAEILERFTRSSAIIARSLLTSQKLVKALEALKEDSLYPLFTGGMESVIEQEVYLAKVASEAASWGRKAMKAVSDLFDQNEQAPKMGDVDLDSLLLFYWSASIDQIEITSDTLERWIEYASSLMNNIEFERGLTPWAQVAQEAEAARRKEREAAIQLENLKAEHKATRLSLLERERVIETKNLEIEHLGAKYRDASHRISEHQQLNDKLTKAEHELADLRKQLREQKFKMQALEERAAHADRADTATPVAESSVGHAGLAPEEQVSGPQGIPAALKSLLGALQSENHWLRQKENSDMFGRTLRDVATKMREAKHWDKVMAGDVPEDQWIPEEEYPEKGLYQPILRNKALNEELRLERLSELGPKESPMGLSPVKKGWQPRLDSPMEDLHRMHDFLGDETDEGFSEIFPVI